MARMKTFFKYFLMLVALYLFVTILTNLCMKENYRDITNYEIKVDSPKIEVTECKAAYSSGYIKGNITNNTEEHILQKYLQISLYNENGVYLGSEYKELKYFNVQETINFDISYQYTKVDKVKIDLVNEKPEQKSSISNLIDIEDNGTKIGVLIGVVLVLQLLLP